MSLKKEIVKKVPASARGEPSFQGLLDLIKEHQFETGEQLANFLEQQIALVEKWLKENKCSGVATAETIRSKAVELALLKKCIKLTKEYL